MDEGQMTSILAEKRARKVAEEDALRLYNRVRQLQKEEDKAVKRIQDTKKKAQEIIRLRERNELTRQEKERRYAEQLLNIEKQKQDNLQKREESQKQKQEQENKLWETKIMSVQQTKEERAEFERMLAESKLLARKEALEQKEAIRRAQEEGRRRIELLKLNRLQMAQDEYERRLKEEMDAKADKEAEIERLAEVEMQLIEKLKAKQTEQRKAYQQLEAVLALGTKSPSRTSSKQQSPRAESPSDQPGEPTEEDVARAFSVYDAEAMGEISAQSLGALMKDLGVPLNASQLSQAIAQLDTSQSGRITFGEFLLWWKG